MKASPSPVVLKHYKDGDFHKDYDRQLTVSSMVNFLRDPTGDIPWEEDANGSDVIHIHDPEVINFSQIFDNFIFYLYSTVSMCFIYIFLKEFIKTSEKRRPSNYDNVLCTMVWFL